MKIHLKYFFLIFGSTLFFQKALAQAPNISYSPSTNAYQVGIAITALTPTNIGGAISSASSSASVSGPSGMGVNPVNGDVYVTQYGGPTVTYYNTSLTYVNTFGTGYTNPDGIVFDASGNGYVADPGANAVYKITPAGVKTTFISGLNKPYGIGIDAAGNLYIADTNAGKILKYSPAGALLLTITTSISTPVDVKVDASGNIYSLNQGTNNVTKYNSAGTFQSIFATGLSAPWALAVDASSNIYIGDSGNNVVDIYNSSGTFLSAKSVTDPEGLAVDAGGDLFISSYSANKLIEFPANNGYTISPITLPAGLSFDSTTGTISGTPTASTAATTYTVIGTNSSGSSTCTVVISTYNQYDWKGTTSTAWATAGNWVGGTVPGSADLARIGVATNTLTRMPVISAATSVGSIQLGESGSLAPVISVNTGITLTVNGAITYQSDANSSVKNYTATLSGAGTISAQNIAVNAGTATGTAYTQTLVSSITALNISGNIGLTSTYPAAKAYNATFNITGGTVALGGSIQTANGTSSTSTFSVANATLQLSGASALSGLSASGTNTITFNGAAATIQYSGTSAQTVYTGGAITGLPAGVSYTNISFSGSAIKTALSGNLTVSGNFTNSLTINDATDYIDLSAPTVVFNSAAQSIAAGNGTGTTFYNVQFGGSGTKTIASGSANIGSTGVLTMSGGSATLTTGGFLTLNSDASGSAAVAQIPTGNSITGNVNAQRYITGGAGYRTYRLISSPVYAATISSTYNVYSINYLQTSIYLTGNAGGGFDKTSNPTLFLYREDLTPSNATFTSGNFWGISAINNSPAYNYYLNGGSTSYNIPVGNGMMFFFRGNRASAPLATETLTSYSVPVTVTLSTTGTLNQGQVVVRDWYTPTSTNIGFTGTGTGGNYTVRGFNLVGNPYASSIDWSTFSNSVSTAPIYGANVAPTVWTFDPSTKNFATYNANTNIATGNGGKIIASGQGFFVLATTTSPSLTFQESAKSSTQATGGKLLMDRRTDLNTLNRRAYSSYIRLKMITDSANYSDVVVGFKSGSSANFNMAEDSKFITGLGNMEAIAAISNDSVRAAVKWLPFPANNISQVIRLRVYGSTTGQYTISRTELSQIPALYEIWLMDEYKKDSLDIKHNSTYVFNIDEGDTSSYGDNRFRLVIRQNPALMFHLLDFAGTKEVNGSQIIWKTENEANYTNFSVERSTDGGKTYNIIDEAASAAQGTYNFLDKSPAEGANMFKLQITDLNGNISYSNVVTIMYGSLRSNSLAKTGMVVYPNPAKNSLNLAIAQGFNSNSINSEISSPTYGIRISNVLGSVIRQASIDQPNWQTDVSALMPGTYVIQVVNKKDNSLVGQSTFVKL